MKTRPAPFFRTLLLALCALATLLFLSSCDSESLTACPTTGMGALEGYLRIDGQGLSRQIGAYALEGPTPGRVTHIAISDSTGWYRLELPVGLYRLEVDPFDYQTNSSDLYDTIRVLPRVFRFDLKRGRAEIRIQMPDDLENQDFQLFLQDPNHASTHLSAEVQDGLLVFDFPCLVPVGFTMRLRGGDLVDSYYLPGYRDDSDADYLQVIDSKSTVYEADLRESYTSIAGNLSGSWQQTINTYRPSIHAVSPDSMGIGKGNVYSDGGFTCGFLGPQKVVLGTEYFGVVQWIGGDSVAAARKFDLQPGDRITGVNFVGSGIQLQFEGPGDMIYHSPSITVTDVSGREFQPYSYSGSPYSICNLRPGRYFLKVEGFCQQEVWAPQWYGGSESESGALAMDLAEGELQSIVMNLVKGGSIGGTLLRADGTVPLAVQFGLFDADKEDMCTGWRQWQQFVEGVFRFQGLANGEHFLAVLANYGKVWWYPGTYDATEATPLLIENHGDLTEVDWRLP